MDELEQIRTRLHTALITGRPFDEVLAVSRCLDAMIVAGMRADKAKSHHCTSNTIHKNDA